MNNYLLRCPNCGKIYKIVNIESDSLVTDFGDKFETIQQVTIEPNYKVLEEKYNITMDSFVKKVKYYTKCIHCNKQFYMAGRDTFITTEDWIADKVFTIKGC